MAQIAISDDVAASLASAASSRGCSQEALASMLIEEGLLAEQDFVLTPEQQTRMMESYAQLRRGETIDGEVVMEKFNRVLQQIASR